MIEHTLSTLETGPGGAPRWRRLAVVGLALALALVLPARRARAQPVTLTTPFPEVNVEAGDAVDLDLDVRSPARQRVDLEVTDLPEGWTATLRSGGFVVGAVTTDPDRPVSVTLNVDIPDDAADGPHTVEVTARAEDGETDRVRADLVVAADVAGAVTLETDFPRLTGGAQDTFTYNVTLRNEVPDEVTFALRTTGPEGWQVEAHPSTQSRATTVSVEGGSTARINVEATPAAGVGAGEFPILLEALGSGHEARIELVAEVVGSVRLRLTTATERLNASGNAGRGTEVSLLVVNDGSAPLREISLSPSPPSGWEVTFDPETLGTVPPGEQVPVTAVITPSEDAVTGDYIVTMRANGQGRSDSVDVRFTVETSPVWGVIGILVVLLAVGGLILVFRRYGRR